MSSLTIALIALIITAPLSAESSSPHYVYTLCDDTSGSYTSNTTFQSNLNTLLSDMSAECANSSFSLASTNSVGVLYSPDDGNVAHGLYYCRGDVQPADCLACVQAASTRALQDCPTQREAVTWYEECTLRYSNRLFPSPQEELQAWISDESAALSSSAFNSDPFLGVFESLVGDLGAGASSSSSLLPRFYSGMAEGLGVSVQCSPQITDTDCEACLRASVGVIPSCCGWQREWVMVFRPSCFIEYRFTNSTDYQDYPQGDYDYSDNNSNQSNSKQRQRRRQQRQRRQQRDRARAKWFRILRDFGISTAGGTTSIGSYFGVIRPAYRKARKHFRSRKHKCHHHPVSTIPTTTTTVEIKEPKGGSPPADDCIKTQRLPPIECSTTHRPFYLDALVLPFDLPDYQQRPWTSLNYYHRV